MPTTNNLKFAIQAAAATAALGVAGQASAVDLNVTDDVDASIYGFARMNMSYDLDGDNAASTRAGSFSKLNDDDDKGHFGADVYQSRLGVKVNHASGVSVTVEGDFRGNGGGDLRMRHAYGEYKGFLAGKTWSNYNSFVGSTPTLDFDSLAGTAGLQDRIEQLRYTTGPVSFSIENPASDDVTNGIYGNSGTPGEVPYTSNDDVTPGTYSTINTRQSAPALTARIQDSGGNVAYSAAGVVNRLTVEGSSNDDSAMGYGVFGAMSIDISDMFSIQGALNFTDGANGYLWHSGENYYAPSAYVDGNDIETIKGYGGSLGASLKLGNGNSINLGYGMTKLDLDDAYDDGAVTGAAAEKNQNVMLNYKMTPIDNVMVGIEYAYFKQEHQGGESDDANRVMFATQYNF